MAPAFAQLAAAHAAPGSIAFAKVDVDAVPDVASRYRVATLPNFTLIRGGEPFQEVKGAYPAQLRSAVESMAKEAKEKGGEEGNAVKKALEDENW
ncbi:uncharacterized protein GLRG_03368 [Colletotrichum graminicola M1.001]|uniref:Thioredoxin domain-containing protein n=1 Tax=Colletotrichum graminicola (strain M1.001 / M2 / FGSC 10212) TaxID=645133 RepID=E3QBY9_COLGM|nr:uncharacterized protein GLRG_03368 [Colletotrichum graminicola M1.001]EFQ28224.1 hypothetical protein GLRG_03368 [Colletotrichum graminicola M1.001]